jgi:2-methylcitrate dehydratase PrpD
MTPAPSVNRGLAEFAASARPPAEAIVAASRAFIDTIAVMLGGVQEPAAAIVRSMVAEESSNGPALIIGTSQRTSAGCAALANGTAAHALDFDDVSFVSLGHPSATLVPAALAAGELVGASGRTLLEAYCIGYDVQGRVGRAMNPAHYQRGWHCTSTIGTLGAAAAAARVLGLDAVRTAHALALGASHASGLKANFGTMTKPLHAGLAARSGVHAALLAARGFTASDAALDGEQGFAVAFDGRTATLESALSALGDRWELVEDGPSVKVYPSCAGTHPTIDALLDLRRTVGFGASDVESIDAGVDEVTPTILLYDRPRTGLQAKFSLHYCAAAAVIDGCVDLDSFDDARVTRAAAQAFLPRVSMRVDRSLDPALPRLTQVAVTIHLTDGRTLRETRIGAKGHPDRPVSEAELAAKFRSCAGRVLSATAVDRALEALESLASLADTVSLTRLLGAAR